MTFGEEEDDENRNSEIQQSMVPSGRTRFSGIPAPAKARISRPEVAWLSRWPLSRRCHDCHGRRDDCREEAGGGQTAPRIGQAGGLDLPPHTPPDMRACLAAAYWRRQAADHPSQDRPRGIVLAGSSFPSGYHRLTADVRAGLFYVLGRMGQKPMV
jgi:hypothetical protein